MKINGHWFRLVCSGLILCSVTFVKVAGQDAERQLFEELQRNRGILPIERLSLTGLATVGGYRLASIRVTNTGVAAWFTEREMAFGYTVKKIAENHVILVPSRGSKEESQLSLSGVGSTSKDEPEPYSKAWINSRANPMLERYHELPRLHQNWSELTDKEKEEIVDFYRKHGWKLVRIVDMGGTTEFVWRNMYEAERTEAMKSNREKFERTLNSDQQGLWKEMRNFKKIYPAEPGRLSEEQKVFIAARQKIIDEFKASLTPEQKAEHASITDFTKANWK
jgi:hypothetical protein